MDEMECTRCNKRVAVPGYKMCSRCQETMRRQYHEQRQVKEQALYDWMNNIKRQMFCTDCGASFSNNPKRAHWDHLPEFPKVDNISDMIRKHASQESILAETQKCELVCPSCHARRGIARHQIGTGPRTSANCRYCGIEYWRRRSIIGKYCSTGCAHRASIKPKPPKKIKSKIEKPLSPRQQWLQSLEP